MGGVRKAFLGLLQFLAGFVLLITLPALVGAGGCTVISGLPSLVHHPSSMRFHDAMHFNARWQLHRVDRLIARAADTDCASTWRGNPDILTDRGWDVYQETAGLFAYSSSDCGSVGRRARSFCMFTVETGVLLSDSERHRAKGLRAAYRAEELDMYQLRDWVGQYCPIKLGVGGAG